MLQERPDVTRTVIQELRQNSPVDAVDIYRRTGMEAFTDLTTAMEVDKNAGLAPEVMSNIKKMAQPPGKKINDPLFARAVETVAIQEALETRGGTRYFTLLTPIQNKERCQGCHGSDHRVRAVVRVATSMEPVFAEVARHRNRQLAIGLLTIVAAGAVLTVTMQRIVLRPVAQTYVNVVPQLVRIGVSNVFGNISDMFSAVNSLLQGKREKLGNDLAMSSVSSGRPSTT